jgi:hypothetical protein
MVSPAQLQKELRTATIIYSANFAAIFVYVAITWLIKQNNLAANINVALAGLIYLRYAFYILSIGLILVIPLLSRIFLGDTAKINNQDALLNKLRAICIIKGSMAEFPAVSGLILFLLSRQELDFYILCGVSFIALIIFFPRQQSWEEFLNKYPQLT